MARGRKQAAGEAGWRAGADRSVLHCAIFLSSPPFSPLPPPCLSPPPPPLLSSPREQAEPASASHCAHSRCSPPLSLPLKEETTGVCMHPPIKTRLVGTLAGRGPGQARRGQEPPGGRRVGVQARRPPERPPGALTQDGCRVWRPAGSGRTGALGSRPVPSSLGLKNQDAFISLVLQGA